MHKIQSIVGGAVCIIVCSYASVNMCIAAYGSLFVCVCVFVAEHNTL